MLGPIWCKLNLQSLNQCRTPLLFLWQTHGYSYGKRRRLRAMAGAGWGAWLWGGAGYQLPFLSFTQVSPRIHIQRIPNPPRSRTAGRLLIKGNCPQTSSWLLVSSVCLMGPVQQPLKSWLLWVSHCASPAHLQWLPGPILPRLLVFVCMPPWNHFFLRDPSPQKMFLWHWAVPTELSPRWPPPGECHFQQTLWQPVQAKKLKFGSFLVRVL